MAKTAVLLVEGVWTVLGTGPLIVTVKQQGRGMLFINNEQEDATSLIVNPRGNAGDQVAENSFGTVSAKATGPGWSVITDTE